MVLRSAQRIHSSTMNSLFLDIIGEVLIVNNRDVLGAAFVVVAIGGGGGGNVVMLVMFA